MLWQIVITFGLNLSYGYLNSCMASPKIYDSNCTYMQNTLKIA